MERYTKQFILSSLFLLSFAVLANHAASTANKIILVTSKYCRHCKQSRPIIEKIIHELKISNYYQHIDVSNPKEYQQLLQLQLQIRGVPTLIIGGEKYIGSQSAAEYKKLLQRFKEKHDAQ